MKYIFIPFAILLFNCSGSKPKTGNETTEKPEEFVMPATWAKDFSITFYEGGGMAYESTNIFLFADSCRYVKMESGVDSIKRFVLTPKEKEDVLAKLKSFNADKIETIDLEGTVYDKETSRMCFANGFKQSHCIESGATQGIKEKTKGDFYKAYSYIVELAKTKTK
ncbi:MAG: hypothetical protein H0W73_13645 [Bacteroidetes bacterium]|nr:hypothetical protein [Bacteroidota bacterium]